MLMEKLRQQIASLAPDVFEQTSNCIDSIRGAVTKAGPTGILALEYTRMSLQEQLVLSLKTSQLALKLSLEQREEMARNVLSLEEALKAANAKLTRTSAKKAAPKKNAKKKKTK